MQNCIDYHNVIADIRSKTGKLFVPGSAGRSEEQKPFWNSGGIGALSYKCIYLLPKGCNDSMLIIAGATCRLQGLSPIFLALPSFWCRIRSVSLPRLNVITLQTTHEFIAGA